jgi:hypothetical protein
MGYFGYLELKQKSQKLRKKGFSYNEINNQLHVSKSTLSNWCKDIALTKEQAFRLFNNKLKGSAKGRIIGAKRQQEEKIKKINNLLIQGKKEVGKLNKKSRFMVGIALYVAEGTKSEKSPGFANSDPKIIKFMRSWFKEFCKIPDEKFRGAIWIHDNLNVKNAEKYWSNLTKIPLNQFHKTYISENKINSKKIRKNLHEFGVFSIRFSDVQVIRRINGWISGVFG